MSVVVPVTRTFALASGATSRVRLLPPLNVRFPLTVIVLKEKGEIVPELDVVPTVPLPLKILPASIVSAEPLKFPVIINWVLPVSCVVPENPLLLLLMVSGPPPWIVNVPVPLRLPA